MRPPASVEKLYTATTALEQMGLDRALKTSVFGSDVSPPAGCGKAALPARRRRSRRSAAARSSRSHYGGVGASVSALVAQLVRSDGIRRVTGSIEGDESLLRLAARRALQRLRLRSVPGRHAQRAGLRPRRNGLRTRRARPRRLRRTQAAPGAHRRRRQHPRPSGAASTAAGSAPLAAGGLADPRASCSG